MATVSEILTGISNAISNKQDQALDKEGKPVKIGLLRDEGEDIKDVRVMDGFNVKVSGKTLIIKYHCEERLNTAHKRDYETDIERVMADIVKYLKKEYKNYVHEALNLTKPSKLEIVIEPVSMRTIHVKATQSYQIGNMEEIEELREPSQDKLDKTVKKFLELGSKEGPKSRNDFRKASEEEEGIVRWGDKKK